MSGPLGNRAPNKVLVVIPHPDDGEGGCGGTLANWIRQGAQAVYVLCTNGDKGSSDPGMHPAALATIREKEQCEAAGVLGVGEVVFLRHHDGALEDGKEFRGEVVREIRKHRPDVVMCMDPYRSTTHTHRDHRISGQVALDAISPCAWGRLYFPALIEEEGLEPHKVQEVYLWGGEDPDTYVDITETMDLKFEALKKHASQISDHERLLKRLQERGKRSGERANLRYAEGFRRLRVVADHLVGGFLPAARDRPS